MIGLRIEKADWSQEAAETLAAAITWGTVESLRCQLDAGAVLFRVSQDDETLAFYMLRVDRTETGSEGVIVAAAGRAGFASLLPYIERQFVGVQSIRVHTSRRGVARVLAAQGYTDGEIVLRKSL